MNQVRLLGVHGPYPAAGGATTGLLLQLSNGNILLDCGAGTFAEWTKYITIEQLDAAILTHHHWDHKGDLGVLQYAFMVESNYGRRTRPLPIYAQERPAEEFKAVAYQNYVIGHALNASTVLELAGARFTFIDTVHALPCLAVRMDVEGKSFVFSGDSGPTPNLEQIARDADVFVCEASWLTADKGAAQVGHLTAFEAGETARRANVKRLVLSHLYPGYDEKDLKREAEEGFGRPVEIGYRGMLIKLD